MYNITLRERTAYCTAYLAAHLLVNSQKAKKMVFYKKTDGRTDTGTSHSIARR